MELVKRVRKDSRNFVKPLESNPGSQPAEVNPEAEAPKALQVIDHSAFMTAQEAAEENVDLLFDSPPSACHRSRHDPHAPIAVVDGQGSLRGAARVRCELGFRSGFVAEIWGRNRTAPA